MSDFEWRVGELSARNERGGNDGLIEVLADCGGLPARLVSIHVDDGHGRCVVCSEGNQSARAVFPCRTRSLATRAVHLQATRLAGRPLPGAPANGPG